LKPEAFVELNQKAVNSFYEKAPWLDWHDRRLLAVDGTRLRLPRSGSIEDEFSLYNSGAVEAPMCMALASFLYDPLNLVVVDACISPYYQSEKELLSSQLDCLSEGDVLLMDRGYPSRELFFSLCARDVDFCARLKETGWNVVEEFLASGKKEQLVTLTLTNKEFEALSAQYPGKVQKSLQFRLLSIALDGGQTEVLCTSLCSYKEFPYEEFKDLYHKRWGVEEAFKLFKARAEVENFSGRTAKSVRQDFYAKVFTMTLMAIMAFPIEEQLREQAAKDTTRKRYQVNRTDALAAIKKLYVQLFIKKKIRPSITAFDELISGNTQSVRPGRSFDRKHGPKKRHHMNYKPV